MREKLLIPLMLVAAGVAGCSDSNDPTGPEQETFTATLTGSAERPNPVTTSATGTATVVFTPSTSSFSYTLAVSGITGVTGAHIHGPATVVQAAGVLVPLATPTSASVNGAFTATSITAAGVSVDSMLVLLRNGSAYVNVHTAANPGGEIRGQLRSQ